MAALAGPTAAQSTTPGNDVDIVVTTPVLGSVVSALVPDAATVTVLMGDGVDPHEWAPSAQDLEAVYAADLVVANGLHLEEGLLDALAEAESNGVPVFEAADHIEVRALADAASDDEHDHAAGDPHFWVDPISMAQVVEALGPVLAELGVDGGTRQVDLLAQLEALDGEVRSLLEPIPAEARKLVTGHESMGYFAERYGLEIVGTVIPGLSSQGEVSARAMADLAEQIRATGVRVIFAEVGTPRPVADAIASETGASVVELSTHILPPDGSYVTFIRGIASGIAEALS
jgi:zinc/manganese transport system substrate-binding protein